MINGIDPTTTLAFALLGTAIIAQAAFWLLVIKQNIFPAIQGPGLMGSYSRARRPSCGFKATAFISLGRSSRHQFQSSDRPASAGLTGPQGLPTTTEQKQKLKPTRRSGRRQRSERGPESLAYDATCKMCGDKMTGYPIRTICYSCSWAVNNRTNKEDVCTK